MDTQEKSEKAEEGSEERIVVGSDGKGDSEEDKNADQDATEVDKESGDTGGKSEKTEISVDTRKQLVCPTVVTETYPKIIQVKPAHSEKDEVPTDSEEQAKSSTDTEYATVNLTTETKISCNSINVEAATGKVGGVNLPEEKASDSEQDTKPAHTTEVTERFTPGESPKTEDVEEIKEASPVSGNSSGYSLDISNGNPFSRLKKRVLGMMFLPILHYERPRRYRTGRARARVGILEEPVWDECSANGATESLAATIKTNESQQQSDEVLKERNDMFLTKPGLGFVKQQAEEATPSPSPTSPPVQLQPGNPKPRRSGRSLRQCWRRVRRYFCCVNRVRDEQI